MVNLFDLEFIEMFPLYYMYSGVCSSFKSPDSLYYATHMRDIWGRVIVVTIFIHLFLHNSLTLINNDEIFLPDFREIRFIVLFYSVQLKLQITNYSVQLKFSI